MIPGPVSTYRDNPQDFAINLWANLASDMITLVVVVALILIVRPKVTAPIVGAVIEAS